MYVARGSHANYFTPGVHPIPLRCYPPQAALFFQALGMPPHDVAAPAATFGPGTPTIVRVHDNAPRWIRFPGTWGEAQYIAAPPFGITPTAFGTSPVGPAFQDDWRDPLGTIAGHLRSGKAQPIGIASPVRHKEFPDIPTMAEQGYASSQVNSWYALAVPKKTQRPVIDRLNRDVNALLGEPETIARFEKIGATLIAGWTPAQTTKMIADEYARWADVAKKAGIAAQ